MKKFKFEQIVNHLIENGFVFQGSEIYDGLSNTWDYGPLGVNVKNNISNYWWQKFVTESRLNVGIDAAILMNPRVWETTGHLKNFNDPLIDCKNCRVRHRADELIKKSKPELNVDGLSNEQLSDLIKEHKIKCTNCGVSDFTDIRKFNMMFKTHIGPVEGSQNVVYLRPETAQGVFVNFRNVQRTMRKKIPFGIANIGKAFRNEITPGNFIFRTREFTQMELEFFCEPGTDEKWFEYWKETCIAFVRDLGVKEDNLRFRDHTAAELSFYSKATVDIEYLFPFGWGEIWGIANRTDYDLKGHIEATGAKFAYRDPVTNEQYIPYCVEPSVGLDRLLLMVLVDSYDIEEVEGEDRIVMRLAPHLAPYQVAVLPLVKKLSEKAEEVFSSLAKKFSVSYDEAGSIGRRYRRQDQVGTPLCVTVDFDSLDDEMVTIRDRDTMAQERVKISDLESYIRSKVEI